jgi:arylsulfatase A-like enzyme
MGDDLSYVVLMDVEPSTVPLLRRLPLLFTIANFAKDELVPRESLWWLHEGNRAVRVGDWKLVAAKGDPWELYDMRTDRAEQINLAAKMPDKVKEIERVWQNQADRFTELARKTLADQPQPPAKSKKSKR